MDYTSCMRDKKIVLVTGFGPVSPYRVNASGEAVKLMKKNDLEMRQNITLITKRVPVEYKYVDKIITKMWREYQPHLIIHVGESEIAQGFTLETQARKMMYNVIDNTKQLPVGKMNPSLGPDSVTSNLRVDLICEEFNYGQSENSLKADVSNEAGLYLCEYIYYTSLCQQLNQFKSSLLIHVPQMKLQQDFEELARGLERIVEICVTHLRAQHCCEDYVTSVPPLKEYPLPHIYESIRE